MTDNFIEVFLYTNENALKQYLTNSEISIAYNDIQSNPTLSDGGYDGILVFNKYISIRDVKSKCCNDSFDTAVVIKLLLNKQLEVIALDENGEQTQEKISEGKNSIAYLIKDSIPFSNVVSIISVEKQLVFLQGDTTLFVPNSLIDKNFYSPTTCLETDHLESLLSRVKSSSSSSDNANDFLDDMDDFDIESMDLSSVNEHMDSFDNDSKRKSKILAGLLMLIQGNHPIQNILTSDLYSILEETTPFTDYISNNIYKNMPFDIAPYIESPNKNALNFFDELRNVACNNNLNEESVFSSAIRALLDLGNNDREYFKKLFLTQLNEQALKKHAEECLSDFRARNRIALLRAAKDDLLPVYALYSFFDYGFDRLNEIILEFGLNGSPYVPILLSLWGLKNGMQNIYEEFKNPEIVYACDKKVSDWFGKAENLISLDTFFSINKIKLKPSEFVVGNFRCSYINTNIEYEYCVGKTVEQIEKNIDRLQKLLKNTFDFQYFDFKQAINKHQTTIVNISSYSNIIHQKYLSLIKKAPKKKSTTRSKTPKAKSNSSLTNLNQEDMKND